MPQSRRKREPDAPYRIKELTEMTGISKETIRFYINEGLMPPPVKSAHNMGWYSDRHVELLGVITKLQTERFLPLKAIRMLLQGRDDVDLSESQGKAIAEMRRHISSEHRDLAVTADAAALAEELQLSRLERKELREFGLARDGKATLSDLEIARQWVAIRDAGLSLERGFTPRDMSFMKDVVDIAFRAEIKIFLSRIDAIPDDDAAKVIDIVIPALSRLFALLHERRVHEFVQTQSLQRKSEVAPPPALTAPANTRRKPRAAASARGSASRKR